ncbi:flavin reductase [Tardiphaga sp. 20_F10_N6_6]|jgi:3-hydroxy-9,10-secoandrosta-1,3,5(10)-triene-9,17-dione monooxygenase reductase component|uniref:flavin reductase n=1 Tax=unclassified Tardiphaga TaxID=2631404 RepID=UPI003F206CE4
MAFDKTAQDKVADNKLPDKAQAVNPATFRQALGQFPTGVTVVTATTGDHPVGMTANSFSSVSLDPPLVLWSVAKSSPSHDPFVEADAFAIHFLGADHGELAMRFGRRGSDKFADIAHAPGISGAPLIEGLAPIFECKTWARYPGGDHTILVGEVVHFVERNHDPLVFHSGQLRRIDKAQPRAPALASNSFARSYLSYLLARASFNVSSSFHTRLKEWDLTVPEWRVLACLADVEGLSVGELAAMALMKQPGLTKVLDRMERDDLLKRKSTSNDRRRVTLYLTAKGRARVKPVQKAALEHETELLSRFSDDERATIKYTLDLLIDSGMSDDTTSQ